MNHQISLVDEYFLMDFESFNINPAEFRHREHIKLAYILLVKHDVDVAHVELKHSLLFFLAHVGAPASKYHETMTRAWLLAVRHFMYMSPKQTSADEFVKTNPLLLDQNIMFTHYSNGLMWSEQARKEFVEPDLDPIPYAGFTKIIN